MDTFKVYMYFLNTKNELYAFTINKKFKEIYEMQRNMKAYYSTGVKEMNEIEYSVFSAKNKNLMLHQDYITSGDNTIEVIVTNDESNALNESCYYIVDFLMSVKSSSQPDSYNKLKLKKKYLKFIIELTDLLMYGKNAQSGTLNIDTFKVFSYIFSDTLYKPD